MLNRPSQPVEDRGQLGAPFAGAAHAARDQQCAKRTFDGLTQPVHHLGGVGGADSEGIGEVGAVQAVAVRQLENRAVAVGQPAGGLGNQIGEFGAGGQGIWARLMRHSVRQFVRNYFAATFPDAAQRFITGDRIQPRAQFVRLLQLRQPGRRGAERVLDAIGGAVAVPQHSHTEVMEPVGVAVIYTCERLTVTGSGGAGELRVGACWAQDVPVGSCRDDCASHDKVLC